MSASQSKTAFGKQIPNFYIFSLFLKSISIFLILQLSWFPFLTLFLPWSWVLGCRIAREVRWHQGRDRSCQESVTQTGRPLFPSQNGSTLLTPASPPCSSQQYPTFPFISAEQTRVALGSRRWVYEHQRGRSSPQMVVSWGEQSTSFLIHQI